MVPLSGSARRRFTGEPGGNAGASKRAWSGVVAPSTVERVEGKWNTFGIFHRGRVDDIEVQMGTIGIS